MPDSCSLKYRLFQPSRKGGKMALTTNLVSNLGSCMERIRPTYAELGSNSVSGSSEKPFRLGSTGYGDGT